MPLACLLLREATPPSLSTLVSKSKLLPPPHPSYVLHLTPTLFSFYPLKPETPDEGFESDIDSITSNGSYEPKATESDSANSSAASDSDTETPDNETHNLVDCVCYTDVTYCDVLVFVIKSEALVFKFDDTEQLQNFHLNFTAVKAVANQKVYSKGSAKFNLLQRTDHNGVTHIEITKEPILRKVWSSADDLLAPKRPERRRKGKAPPPPPPTSEPRTNDVLRGEYVRVNVNSDVVNKDFIAKSQLKEKKAMKPNLVAFFVSKPIKSEPVWSNSLRKQRSRSETRSFTPMAYRYIDTAPKYQPMGDRLFGLTSKLRDFDGRESRWNKEEGKEKNLKSVIKKEEGRKKNEKKVTFSAYTTVQVV